MGPCIRGPTCQPGTACGQHPHFPRRAHQPTVGFRRRFRPRGDFSFAGTRVRPHAKVSVGSSCGDTWGRPPSDGAAGRGTHLSVTHRRTRGRSGPRVPPRVAGAFTATKCGAGQEQNFSFFRNFFVEPIREKRFLVHVCQNGFCLGTIFWWRQST